MKRFLLSTGVCALVLACLSLPFGCKPGKVVFMEDFESFSPGAWTAPGVWSAREDWGGIKPELWTIVEDGNKYLQAGQVSTIIGAGDESWRDYTLSARVRPGNAAEHGIAVRYNASYDDYYELCLTDWKDGKGVVKLWKIVDGQIQQLGKEVPFAYDFSTFYDLKIAIRGRSIKCYLNDTAKPLISYTDNGTILGNYLRNGKIGLYTQGNAAFDDVRVTM